LFYLNDLMEPYWDLIERIIKESDIVLEILDARLINLSRNEQVETLIKTIGRPCIFVINKSDLVSKEYLRSQIIELQKSLEDNELTGDIAYISTKYKMSTKILLHKIKKIFKKYGKREQTPKGHGAPKQKYKEAWANIVVGILGYPNVGKSSIINRVSYKKKAKVGKRAGTTHGIHWINVNKDIMFIDSPGVIPLKKDDEVRYGLIGARDSQMLSSPDVVANSLIRLFLDKNKETLSKYYKIDTEDINDSSEGHAEEIILKIGKQRHFLLKGGEIDLNRTSMLLVRDWQEGRLRL
jgi:ribosome biogenesis GTPase A